MPLSSGAIRPTQGKTLAVMEVSGGSQSFNAVNNLRVLGRWMRMLVIPNQVFFFFFFPLLSMHIFIMFSSHTFFLRPLSLWQTNTSLLPPESKDKRATTTQGYLFFLHFDDDSFLNNFFYSNYFFLLNIGS